jgi:hypothetical protein
VPTWLVPLNHLYEVPDVAVKVTLLAVQKLLVVELIVAFGKAFAVITFAREVSLQPLALITITV